MPVSSHITSVDTLQILPASEAFVVMDTQVATQTDSLTFIASHSRPDIWEQASLNWGLMAFAIILVILYMRKYVTIMPYLVSGILWWKRLAEIDQNMRLARDRDALVLPAVVIMSITVARLGLYNADFMAGLNPDQYTLVCAAICLGFLLLRALMILVAPRRRVSREAIVMGNAAGKDFLIIASSEFLALVIIASISNDLLSLSKTLAYYTAGGLWLLMLYRKNQIMSAFAGQLQAILYLCTVEIIPAVALVVSMIFL